MFRKDESQVEILNDINLELITLYRVIKHHLEEFMKHLKWILVSRDEFERFRAMAPETLTDILRAVRFYYLLRNGYSSRIPKPAFSISTLKRSNFNILRMEEELSLAHMRLGRVYIENIPYEKVIARFDRPHTFFYLDPPYYGCEDYYGKEIFDREDFARLASILNGISGRFIMSINDTPEIRSLFSSFRTIKAPTTYLAGGAHHKKKVTELLILNYDPEAKSNCT